ncbi:MAG: ChaB family protein [Alphaproteobacteria bacterium]
MPYRRTADLPPNVKKVLPPHAQAIYLAAFNNAWHEYSDPFERRNQTSLEETAHRVAWAAVKSKYRKQDDMWVSQSRMHPVAPTISFRKQA